VSFQGGPVHSFGLVVRTTECEGLPSSVLSRFEVVDDGGLLVKLDGCPVGLDGVVQVVDAIRWLDAAGVDVHRVVELPTDAGSAAHRLAETVNARLARS
jgi:hypothetical protein